MKAIKEKLGLERNDLIALALLLGCDYCPKGVAHIGVVSKIIFWKFVILPNWDHVMTYRAYHSLLLCCSTRGMPD